MVDRRSLLTGGILGGLFGSMTGDDAAAQTRAVADGAVTERAVEKIAAAIDELKRELHGQAAFADILPVRDAQKQYLRGNGKFPDYIEVGTEVWFAVHDWHIRWQQPMTVGRDALGRYTIALNQTTVIMRLDAAVNFVGIRYDNR